ncbi:MAG: hypothetical protein NWS38_07125 [Alphaproteobacteria bacterium]|nr:hypothetical protein [Alphaproteobacteria bacterium]
MKSRTADSSGFSAFFGIDWSGAKAKSHVGLQLAHATPGTGAPLRVSPPLSKYWSRQQVSDYLIEIAENAKGKDPVLVGIDFAFAHPFADKHSYFPENDLSPVDVVSLWAMIDQVNAGQPDLYGGAMFRHAIWGDYYLAPPHYQARHYASRRRVTEIAARTAGRSPSPTFKAVGADNVSTGSLAGMRMLHRLKQHLGARLSVWPFDAIIAGQTNLVLVEIFPSFYFYRLGMVPAKKAAADPAFLNQALASYGSDGVPTDFRAMGRDADEADAIIAAAALRHFSTASSFCLSPDINVAAQQEGWIYGVPFTLPDDLSGVT